MSGRGEVRRYWDSTCFLSILNGEDEAGTCEGILADARAGQTTIVVSPLSQLEVIRRKGSPAPVPPEQRDTIRQWFENGYICCTEISREVGATAQRYCWDLNVHPRDAIHIAVAVRARCDLLETLNPSLLKWDGKIPDSTIRIRRPGPDPARTLVEDTAERGGIG